MTDEIDDQHWDQLLRLGVSDGPDPFFEERLLRAVRAQATEYAASSDERANPPRLLAAAVLFAAVGIVGYLLTGGISKERSGQGKGLKEAIEQLRSSGHATRGAQRLRQAGAAAVGILVANLGDRNPAFVAAIQDLLAAVGKPAIEPLRKLVRDKDHLVLQLRAIQTFARMGPDGVAGITDLLPVLEQAGAPWDAVRALGVLIPYREEAAQREATHVAILNAVYRQDGAPSRPQPHSASVVARAIQRSNVETIDDRDVLHGLLVADDPFQRELAAELLRQHGDASSILKLRAALLAKHPHDTEYSISAGGVNVSNQQRVNHDIPIRVAAARALVVLARDKPAAAQANALLLSQGSLLERLAAAEALGRIGVAEGMVLPSLLGQLGGQDRLLRAAIITSLGMLGPPAKEAIPRLEVIAGGDDREFAARATAALRQIRKTK